MVVIVIVDVNNDVVMIDVVVVEVVFFVNVVDVVIRTLVDVLVLVTYLLFNE